MLGKLLKHEFRATGRTMLPVFAAVVVLTVLANFSIRMIENDMGTMLNILFGLVIAAFFIWILAATILTIVMMVKRFYINYLKDEGYLMHTLPVSVHELVWSKMIVSVVWFLATFLLIWLVIILTVLFQTGTNLAEIFAQLPSWEEIRAAMAEIGVRESELWLMLLESLLLTIVGGLFTCLHFYAAMSLGHMFSKDKILLSVVFFVGISFVLSLASTGYNVMRVQNFENLLNAVDSARDGLRFVRTMLHEGLIVELVESAALYVATTLSLKKGLNLA